MAGTLYLVGTPIGNLEDMTFRAIRILKEVDLIAAEDTRNSIKLLNHFEIKTKMTSYHEFNKIEKAYELVNLLKAGNDIALITDAGMPGISDPGEELVAICMEEGVSVTVVPGPSAVVSALSLSGQKTRRFSFEAFLPKDKEKRKAVLDELKKDTRTIIIYEAPHHLKKTLQELRYALGDRSISIVKEITKLHENVFKTTIEEALIYYEENEPKGEYVLVIEGLDREAIEEEKRSEFESLSVEEHLQMYIDRGIDKKEAMKLVAKDRGVSKRDIYNLTMK